MTMLLILVPVSVLLLGLAIAAFVWAVRGGQFDELDTPPLDILRDDPPTSKPTVPASSVLLPPAEDARQGDEGSP